MLRRPWICALFVVAGACAHTAAPAPDAVAGVPQPGAQGDVSRRVLDDATLGYSVELPASIDFHPVSGSDAVVAVAPDGTLLRVLPLFFRTSATERMCWDDMARELKARDGTDWTGLTLQAAGSQGVPREGRTFFMTAAPRDTICLVLVVEGPTHSATLAQSASLAMSSFRLKPPSGAMAARLAFEAGLSLMEEDGRDAKAALERFEETLRLEPKFEKAELGAGLAAFFAGAGYEDKAVMYLERVLARREQNPEKEELEPQQLKDALMYLGLAHAARKDYAKAAARLAETIGRFPGDAIALYNFACVLALSGDPDEAFVHLRSSLELAPDLAAHARTDTDLDSLHARPEWDGVVGGGAPAKGPQSNR